MSQKNINLPENAEILTGSPWLNIVQLVILMGKYQDQCIFMPVNLTPTEINESDFSMNNFELLWENNTLYPPLKLGQEKWVDLLRDCALNSTRFVVMPLAMYNYSEKDTNLHAHENILIYDKSSRILERYEPNGKKTPSVFNPKELDKALQNEFSKIFETPIQILGPEEFCPTQGLQYIENLTKKTYNNPLKQGTCSLWSFVYVDYRLKYPDLSRDNIHDKIYRDITSNNTDLYEFIVNYLNSILNLSQIIKNAKSEEEIGQSILNMVNT
jgi:hypothetical protein